MVSRQFLGGPSLSEENGRLIRASKTEGRPLIRAKYKSSLNGDFNDICNKTCGSFDRFDCALRFKYRAISANAG
jgi:hypothetical protein